jgi:hypothetical protein
MAKPFSAITPEYLRFLAERDDEPRTAAEADLAGPWHIAPLSDGRHGLFRLGEDPRRGHPPFCTAQGEEEALLLAALLPGTGRDPLYRLQTEAAPEGFAIESDGEVVAHLSLFDPSVADTLHAFACALRSPVSFAYLIQAASGLALAHVDRILTAWAISTRKP